MFGYSPKNAANAYSKMNMETGVLVADPHKLILMLFDGAIVAIINGTQQLRSNKLPEKTKSVAHAIAIVEHGLRASLNKEIGGELAKNLDALYTYMVLKLMAANVDNDVAKLDEVKGLLSELRTAWEQIAPAKQANAVTPEEPAGKYSQPIDPLAPRKSSHISA